MDDGQTETDEAGQKRWASTQTVNTHVHTHTYTHSETQRKKDHPPPKPQKQERESYRGSSSYTHTHTHTAEIMHKQSKIRSGSSGELKEMKLEAAREPAAKFQNSKKGSRTPREVRR